MKQQNYSNHSRYVIGYHVVTLTLIAVLLVSSVIHCVKVFGEPRWYYRGLMPVLTIIAIALVAAYTRIFPLKAQDRAIRAEENFRHFVLTGIPLDKRLNIWQIIALRFASDEEFPGLAAKAASENLSPKAIKKEIINWKPDKHRA
jgi:hypothetical protein